MAIEVGSAFLTIIPSMRGASAAIRSEIGRAGIGTAVERELSSKATTAGTRAGGLFSRAFSRSTRNANFPGPSASLLRNIRTYGYAVAGVTGLTVGLGLKTASAMEQAKIAFTTMLGSARKAGAFLHGLVKFAQNTPFDVPGVISASQKLLAFGFSAKKIKPDLRALGDAAAGLNLGTEGLDRLTTAIGQIRAKGKLQSDELLQLTEAGVPALQILANTFGLTTGAMQDMVTKGLVPANKAIPALLRGLETGTDGLAGHTARFAGLMQKESKTLGGIFSNLKDKLSQGLARAVRPLVPVLERELPRAMKKLPGIFQAAARDMRGFLTGLGLIRDRTPGAASGFEKFGSAVRSIAGGVRKVFGFISAQSGTFKVLAVAVGGAVLALKGFKLALAIGRPIELAVIAIGRLAGAQWALDAAMDANPIGAVVTAIGAFVAGLIYAYKTSKTFRDIVKSAFHVLEVAVGHWVGINVTAFRYVADAMLTFVGVMLHGASKAFGWVPGVGGKLKSAAAAFDGFRSDVDSTLAGIASDAFSFGSTAGSNWDRGFKGGLNGGARTTDFAQATKLAMSGAAGADTSTAKNAGKVAAPVYASVGNDLGGSLGDGISKGVKDSASKVGKSAKDLIDKILTPLRDLRQKAAQLAHSVAQAILGDTGFGALANSSDAFGETGFGGSVKQILAGFLAQRKAVRQFRRELTKLEHRGLSEAAIREIANEGLTAGGALAQTLMGATRKQLRQISRLRRQTHVTAGHIGTERARGEFGADIARQLVRTQRAIEKASHNTDLTPKTIHRMEHAFKHAVQNTKVYVDTDKISRRDGKIIAGLV